MDLTSLFRSRKNVNNLCREILKVCPGSPPDHIRQIAYSDYYVKLADSFQKNNKYRDLFTQLNALNSLFINDYRSMFGCSVPKDKLPDLSTPDAYRKVNLFNDKKAFFHDSMFDQNNKVPKRGENVGNYRRYVDKGGSVEGMPGMREYDTLMVTNRLPYYELTDEIFDPTPDPRYHMPTRII